MIIQTIQPVATPVKLSRTVRNDQTILAAALRVLVDEGWSALSPRHVAQAAHVSRTAVLARYADRSAIGAAVWRSIVADTMLTNWTALVKAVDEASGSDADLQSAMAPFLQPDDVMRAANELILVANHDEDVRQAISDTVGDELTKWTTPTSGRVTRSLAAQRAFVLGLAHGYLTEAMRHHTSNIDLSAELTRLASALARPAKSERLPSRRADYLDAPLHFGTGDAMVEAVLGATLTLIGKSGFDATTIEAITETAGFSRSVIFNRYATKRDLFVDATNRVLAGLVGLGDAYQQAIASTHGVAIAEACLLREIMRPGREIMRSISFEQIRLSWHDVDLLAALDSAIVEHQALLTMEDGRSESEIRGHLVTEMALGHGIVSLTVIEPDIWDLPLSVVLVPFRSH